MKNGTAIQNSFRLVGRPASPWDDASDHAVRCPQMLQPYDPRWVFAVRVASELERTEQAALQDEHREKLIHQASTMGLARFDAQGVIAIVAGQAAAGRPSLGADTEFRLANMGGASTACPTKTCGVPVALAVAITTVVMAVFTYAALTL